MKSFSYFLFVWAFAFQACSQAPKSTKAMDQLPTSEAEWKAKLSEEEFYILRQKGTERPYTGKFLMHVDKGYYTCKGCGTRLFKSDSKFDSHCGWPSFDEAIKGAVIYKKDLSFGMVRTEVMCAKCEGHLGHVFDDGPEETTGQRYCTNSVSIKFVPETE